MQLSPKQKLEKFSREYSKVKDYNFQKKINVLTSLREEIRTLAHHSPQATQLLPEIQRRLDRAFFEKAKYYAEKS